MLQSAIEYAWQRGVLLVASAGNESVELDRYPAACPNVLSVAALDEGLQKAEFSNFGESVDFAAPGTDIWSTARYGEYGTMSGTSMASPIVAGFAALAMSMRPDLGLSEIVTLLRKTAIDIGEPGRDRQFGHGLISVPRLQKSLDFKVASEFGYTMDFSFHPPSGAELIRIEQSTDGGKTWQHSRTATPLRPESMSVTVFNLTPTTSYLFRMHIIGGPYHGVSSYVRHKMAFDSMPPSAPTEVKIVDRADVALLMSWTASNDNKGIRQYEIYSGKQLLGKTAKTFFQIRKPLTLPNSDLTIVAVDTSGNRSPASAPLAVNVLK
jgi:hypothetical protein